MTNYVMFGKNIAFSDGALLYYDLIHEKTEAGRSAAKQFEKWYESQGNIESIMKGYPNISCDLVKQFSANQLFPRLKEFEIYDLSEKNYCAEYTSLEEAQGALSAVEEKYADILRQQGQEEEYRAMRKATRGRWQGGGFGLSGALKGAAQAGALNMVTGGVHSVANALGNAMTSISASSSKQELYSNPGTKKMLRDAICEDIFYTYNAFMNLLNEHKSRTVEFVYDVDKAIALFENAKQIPQKEHELLIQSFKLCPWNYQLYTYIFENYPAERKTMISASERFDVDLTPAYEKILSNEYTETAQSSEEEAMKARQRIILIMDEFGIQESTTLDTLENDCLTRVCAGLAEKDEMSCNKMIEKVSGYNALEKNKEPYLKKIQQRIEDIWSVEDGEIFDNIYLRTNITSKLQVNKSKARIRERARTKASDKYIEALDACTEDNIKKALSYYEGKRPGLYFAISVSCIIAALAGISAFNLKFSAVAVLLVVGIVFGILRSMMRTNWKTLTISETLFHPQLMNSDAGPVITVDEEQQAKTKPQKKAVALKWGLTVVLTVVLCALLAVFSMHEHGAKNTIPNNTHVVDPSQNEEALSNDALLPDRDISIPDQCTGEYYSDRATLNFYGTDSIGFFVDFHDFTVLEKKTEHYIAIQIPGKDSGSVLHAMQSLRNEYGEKFAQVFKTITVDNGPEFSSFAQVENWGSQVYFAHPYTSWERPQNELYNGLFQDFVPKGISIESFSLEYSLSAADELNGHPRKKLGYRTPKELFEVFLDSVYAVPAS